MTRSVGNMNSLPVSTRELLLVVADISARL